MKENIQNIKNKMDDISNTLNEILNEIKKNNEFLQSKNYYDIPSLEERKEWSETIKAMADGNEIAKKQRERTNEKMKELGFLKAGRKPIK